MQRKARLEEKKAFEEEKKRKAEEAAAARPAKKRAVNGGGGDVEGGLLDGIASAPEQARESVPQAVPNRGPGPIPEGKHAPLSECAENVLQRLPTKCLAFDRWESLEVRPLS